MIVLGMMAFCLLVMGPQSDSERDVRMYYIALFSVVLACVVVALFAPGGQ